MRQIDRRWSWKISWGSVRSITKRWGKSWRCWRLRKTTLTRSSGNKLRRLKVRGRVCVSSMRTSWRSWGTSSWLCKRLPKAQALKETSIWLSPSPKGKRWWKTWKRKCLPWKPKTRNTKQNKQIWKSSCRKWNSRRRPKPPISTTKIK